MILLTKKTNDFFHLCSLVLTADLHLIHTNLHSLFIHFCRSKAANVCYIFYYVTDIVRFHGIHTFLDHSPIIRPQGLRSHDFAGQHKYPPLPIQFLPNVLSKYLFQLTDIMCRCTILLKVKTS